MIHLDSTFGQEFFDVSVGKSIAQVPADYQQDDLWREPITSKRRSIKRWRHNMATAHPNSLADL